MRLPGPVRSWWLDESTFRTKLLVLIGGMAMTWYFISILAVGCTDLSGKALTAEMRQFMSISITTISGTLATYLGMILGFGQIKSGLQRDAGRTPTDATARRQAAAVVPSITKIQAVAAVAYVVSLILALVLWFLRPEAELDSVILNLGRSILGLFGGVLAVILNVEDPA